jgi:hypothetical protein
MQKTSIDTSKLVDLATGKLPPEEGLLAFEEIERRKDQSESLELSVQLVNLASARTGNVFRDPVPEKTSVWLRIVWRMEEICERKPMLYPLGAFCLLAIAASCVAISNQILTSPFEELTTIDRTSFAWRVRGGDEEDIGEAYRYFIDGEYQRSAEHLERYLRTHQENGLSDYVHFSLGTVYLLDARHTILSLFPRYHGGTVNRALSHLRLASDSRTNRRLREESLMLSAKGYLMLSEPDSAIVEYRRVAEMEGDRSTEARQLIERLNAIKGGGR